MGQKYSPSLNPGGSKVPPGMARRAFHAVPAGGLGAAAAGGGVTPPPVVIVTRRDDFNSPTPGQTVFNLSATPSNPASVEFHVNGVEYHPPDIVIAGAVVTWAGPIVIAPTDTVWVRYTTS